ncbi:hypothetical protein NL676_012058 [Syzygium grande]|nr:hypothetical protein NL676_012058 [Syzygium grande]
MRCARYTRCQVRAISVAMLRSDEYEFSFLSVSFNLTARALRASPSLSSCVGAGVGVSPGGGLVSFLIFPFMLWRMLHNQIWITWSRYRNARGNGRIVDKGIEFEQVGRERDWDDQILFNGLTFYIGAMTLAEASCLPVWRSDGVITTILLHVRPVEFLYYWLHRALHHHYLYSRYHSHHHSSIITEPITSVIHPFAEHVVYFLLFAIPLLITVQMGTASIMSFVGYVTYIDLMNNMGHCNFELIPKWIFSYFPPLKYLMYTPS